MQIRFRNKITSVLVRKIYTTLTINQFTKYSKLSNFWIQKNKLTSSWDMKFVFHTYFQPCPCCSKNIHFCWNVFVFSHDTLINYLHDIFGVHTLRCTISLGIEYVPSIVHKFGHFSSDEWYVGNIHLHFIVMFCVSE